MFLYLYIYVIYLQFIILNRLCLLKLNNIFKTTFVNKNRYYICCEIERNEMKSKK